MVSGVTAIISNPPLREVSHDPTGFHPAGPPNAIWTIGWDRIAGRRRAWAVCRGGVGITVVQGGAADGPCRLDD